MKQKIKDFVTKYDKVIFITLLVIGILTSLISAFCILGVILYSEYCTKAKNTILWLAVWIWIDFNLFFITTMIKARRVYKEAQKYKEETDKLEEATQINSIAIKLKVPEQYSSYKEYGAALEKIAKYTVHTIEKYFDNLIVQLLDKTSEEMIKGSGEGEPVGIFNSECGEKE